MSEYYMSEQELDEARETVAIPLGNGIEIPLNLKSGRTGFKGVGVYDNHPGKYVAQPSKKEVMEVDPRIIELPKSAFRGETFFVGFEDDPRKAAYRRAYMIRNISKFLDKFFALPTEKQNIKNWANITDTAKIPFPENLFKVVPEPGEDLDKLRTELVADKNKPAPVDPAKEKLRLSAMEIFNSLKADKGISAALNDLTEIGRKAAFKRLQDVALKKQANPDMNINMSDLARGIKIDQGKLEESGQLDESIERMKYLTKYLKG